MRTQETIQEEYKTLCLQLGELESRYKLQYTQLLNAIAALHQENAELQAKMEATPTTAPMPTEEVSQ